MFMSRWIMAVSIGLAYARLCDAQSPMLGEPVSEAELADIDYVVLPDGRGLPSGSGTAAEGKDVYEQHCLACHGASGADGINDRLVGGHGTIDTARPEKTVGSYWPYATTLFDYIRRAMPYQTPGSLSADEVYGLTAYVLFLNDIVDENERLNADTLPAVKMPNRENFVWGYEPK
ncbi:MAG TPA: cytochrome c [Woeseiaceae bacterium]|nr:cytochrome c [Woeseiaceae bacterium]